MSNQLVSRSWTFTGGKSLRLCAGVDGLRVDLFSLTQELWRLNTSICNHNTFALHEASDTTCPSF